MLLARGVAVTEDDVDTDGVPRYYREAWTKIKQSSSEIAEEDRAWVVNFFCRHKVLACAISIESRYEGNCKSRVVVSVGDTVM